LDLSFSFGIQDKFFGRKEVNSYKAEKITQRGGDSIFVVLIPKMAVSKNQGGVL
jgi:hypothetical protein